MLTKITWSVILVKIAIVKVYFESDLVMSFNWKFDPCYIALYAIDCREE